MDKQRELDKIAKSIQNCAWCKLNKIGKAVPGEGSANADIVFLGEAPGKKEAESGRPFVGPAGRILRELIKGSGLEDKDVYITSPVKYLPKYVTPTIKDVEHGKMHLIKQLRIIAPKVIVLMGKIAALSMLSKNVVISKEHGKIIDGEGVKYLLTYHPAAPLYSPKVKRELVKDFKLLSKLVKKKYV